MAALLGAAVPQHSWEAISSPLISEEGIAPPWLGGEIFVSLLIGIATPTIF